VIKRLKQETHDLMTCILGWIHGKYYNVKLDIFKIAFVSSIKRNKMKSYVDTNLND